MPHDESQARRAFYAKLSLTSRSRIYACLLEYVCLLWRDDDNDTFLQTALRQPVCLIIRHRGALCRCQPNVKLSAGVRARVVMMVMRL